mmetsp:Transcript_19962/g.28282  ORF Transcript_19962/g.28282 Transcript_19962/m.28282 type:complete len:140 (-) Transcript_19962:6-425(-)
MEYTDQHFRHLVRLVSNRTLLYTEMVAANALSHERRAVQDDYRQQHPTASDGEVAAGYSDQYLRRYLAQGQVQPLEGPSVLQLGGSDPAQMFEAAQTSFSAAFAAKSSSRLRDSWASCSMRASSNSTSSSVKSGSRLDS